MNPIPVSVRLEAHRNQIHWHNRARIVELLSTDAHQPLSDDHLAELAILADDMDAPDIERLAMLAAAAHGPGREGGEDRDSAREALERFVKLAF